MATLTWIGGGNNSAGNPKDWSGDTTPKPGDTLILSNGATINVTGNQLQGDTLNISYPGNPGIPETATINLSGLALMQLQSGYETDININLAANSIWVGGFTMEPGDQFNISGKGFWDNDTTTYTDQNTNVGVSVIGTGTIEANQAHSQGKLTFLHGVSVGSGQTVVINGYELYGGQFGTAEVQSPSLYHAATELARISHTDE